MSIQTKLKSFKLAGIVKSFEVRIQEAQESNMSYTEFLELILEDEDLSRKDNKKKRLFTKAKLPTVKHISDFDFSFQPSIKKAEITQLGSCGYIQEGKNVVFIGNPGTGKSHLAIALGVKALGLGYSVLFTTLWNMIDTLQQSRADLSYKRKIEYYCKPDLLIIDELGYRAMSNTTVEDFFEIISKRHEQKSTIITTNKKLADWDKVLLDKTLSSALVDRILQNCSVIEIDGVSYRTKNSN